MIIVRGLLRYSKQHTSLRTLGKAGDMRSSVFNRESVIFATGVMCGFLMRTLMANSSHSNNDHTLMYDEKKGEKNVTTTKENIRKSEEKSNIPIDIKGTDLFPECSMKVPEIIKYAGYHCEEHAVTTNDGYILGLHRIPYGKDSQTLHKKDLSSNKPIVFLQHGLLADSANWVSNGPNSSLAFILADSGFDVWMGNVRGNTYSRKHTHLDPDMDEKFWRYSWQQFSEIDLSAMVDFVLEKTGKSNLNYIGHSQGTLIMFAKLAEDPKFNDKIKLLIALGPVFHLQHIKSPIKFLAQFYNTLEIGQWMLGGGELLPNSAAGKWLAPKLHTWLQSNPDVKYQGENFLFNIAGFNPNRYFHERMPVYVAHIPAGTSIQNIIHYAQMVANNRTCKFSYETAEQNKEAYGSSTPPGYDLTAIRTPVALFWGTEDWFADTDDVLSIIPLLKNLVVTKEFKEWDHLEFLYGSDAVVLYKDIVKLIRTGGNKREQGSVHSDL